MSGFNTTTKTSAVSSPLNADGSPVNNNFNRDWALGGDAFSCCYEMSPMDDTMQAGMSSVQSGLDGHLPLLYAGNCGTQDGLMLDLNSPAAFLDCGGGGGGSPDYSAGPLFERRKRSRSNSSRQRFNEVVTELGPEEVRWFYKEDKKTWKAFLGHDSLNIEHMFRRYCERNPGATADRVVDGGEEDRGNNGEEGRGLNGAVSPEARTGSADGSAVSSSEVRDPDGIEINIEPVCVRGGLYEVDVKERECKPVYWKRECHGGQTVNKACGSMLVFVCFCFASVTGDAAPTGTDPSCVLIPHVYTHFIFCCVGAHSHSRATKRLKKTLTSI